MPTKTKITKYTIKIHRKKGGNFAVVHNGYSRTRTYDTSVNSRSLCQLSYTPVGCLLLTSFTLSAALGYADCTKYRLLNLFLFVLADLRISAFWYHLRCKAGVHSPEQTSAVQPVYSHHKAVYRSRTCLPYICHGIKTPPDKKGEKSGGVPNVWKDCFRTIYNRSRIIIS